MPSNTNIRVKQGALMVDDDPDVLEVTADMLRQLGYCVTTVDGGQQALDAWDEAEHPPGLVVLDFAMPGMNGLAVARALRERGFAGAIVLATGYADLTEVGQIEPGILQAVLNKPYSFQELERVLLQVEERMIDRLPLSLIEPAH
jgi:CheY-like chemotaxis protein